MTETKTCQIDMSREKHKKWRDTRLAWLLLSPSMVFLAVFTIYPIAYSLVMSMYKNNMATFMTGPQFVGISNYMRLFTQDQVFRDAFWNNIIIAIFTVPISIAMAILMAMGTNKATRGKGLLRIAFFYPTLLPMVAVANLWLFIYTPIYGLLGYLNPNWHFLTDPDTVLGAMIVMLIWKQAGYVMIFYISALQGIDHQLYEAGRIDGAGGLAIFRHITWPLLKPTTLYVTIIALTNAYKMVDHLYIMTKGGPGNASNMLLFYVYQKAFDQSNTGVASAVTVVLITLLLVITCVQFFTQDKRTFYS